MMIYRIIGIGSSKEKFNLLKTKVNVDHVGHLQLLVRLKPKRLSNLVLIPKIIPNNVWLIVINLIMDAVEVGLEIHYTGYI